MSQADTSSKNVAYFFPYDGKSFQLDESRQFVNSDAAPLYFLLAPSASSSALTELSKFLRHVIKNPKTTQQLPDHQKPNILFPKEFFNEVTAAFNKVFPTRGLVFAGTVPDLQLAIDPSTLIEQRILKAETTFPTFLEVFMDAEKLCGCDFNRIWQEGRDDPRLVTLLKMFPERREQIELYMTAPFGELGAPLFRLRRETGIVCIQPDKLDLLPECQTGVDRFLQDNVFAPGDGNGIADVEARMRNMFSSTNDFRERLIGAGGFFNGGFVDNTIINPIGGYNNEMFSIQYGIGQKPNWIIVIAFPLTDGGRLRDTRSITDLVAEASSFEKRYNLSIPVVRLLAAPAFDIDAVVRGSRADFQIQMIDWFSVNSLYQIQVKQSQSRIQQTRSNSVMNQRDLLYRLFTDLPGGLWRTAIGLENFRNAVKG